MTSRAYDIVIVGAGLSGLSLACQLAAGPLRDQTILLIDKVRPARNDRTWCFWTRTPTVFDDVVSHNWDRLYVAAPGFARVLDLGEYRYKMIRGVDFFRGAMDRIAAQPNIHVSQGVVTRIDDTAGAGLVTVDGRVIAARWVFDSRWVAGDLLDTGTPCHALKLHFRGWEIETSERVFDPSVPTFFDFRTPQSGDVRFFYVLPVSDRQALVEYTLFAPHILPRQRYELALREYLCSAFGVTDFRVLREEGGVIPATDRPLPRRAGRHVMNIGTRGGRVKPTSGYAFMRIQHDSAAIAASLVQRGHPFDVPAGPARYRWYDAILLDIMCERPEEIAPVFATMFKRNPVARVLRFLDEIASAAENAQLISTLPPRVFLEAMTRMAVGRSRVRSGLGGHARV